MSHQESDARRRSNQSFRTVMDLGMGVFYIAVGAWLILNKSFGNMSIPPFIAYLLGAMMEVGGAFRLRTGIRALLPEKKETE